MRTPLSEKDLKARMQTPLAEQFQMPCIPEAPRTPMVEKPVMAEVERHEKNQVAKAPKTPGDQQLTTAPVVAAPGKPAEDPDKQSSLGQIVRFIPAEVVAFYVPILGALATVKTLIYADAAPGMGYAVGAWAIFVLAFIGSFLYMYKTAMDELIKKDIAYPKQRATLKAGISAGAFIIWAICLGGPFGFIKFYEAIGAVAILVFTFVTPWFYMFIPIPFPGTIAKPKPPSTLPQSGVGPL